MEKEARTGAGVWERMSAGDERGRQPRLSHERIAQAAFSIAEHEGLESVTMRRVAKELGAATMSLYRYVETKEELHELLLDEAIGRMSPPEPRTGDWRADLRGLAVRRLAELRRRPWIITLRSSLPTLGPHSMSASEHALSLVDGLGFTIDEMIQIIGLLDAHVSTLVSAERVAAAERQRAGMDDAELQAAYEPYLKQLLGTGRYPYFERIVVEAEHPPIDAAFEFGLEIVLDGVAARVGR